MHSLTFSLFVPKALPSSRKSTHNAPKMTSSQPFDHPHRVSRSVVWFRDGDLRVADHPGLEAACAHTSTALAPLLVITPQTPLTTLHAARRLQYQLHNRGSHLVLRFALDEAAAVVDFLSQYSADRVHVRMDAEHSARSVISRVERALDGITGVQVWSTNLRDWDFPSDLQYLPNLPQTFPDFLAWPPRRAAQLLPSSVSFLPQRILPGPGIDDSHFPIDEVSRCLAAASVPSEERRQFMLELEQDNRFVNTMELDDTRADFGEYAILEYLRCADAYKFPDLARSLAEVFRQGALSSARIQELVHDHERKNGRIWRFVYREGAKMILDYLEAREFATLMARRDVATEATIDGQHVAKFWRWNGFLIRYIEEGRRNGVKHGKPPLLLVHGFGGSSQHFRRSIVLLKERYHVFAVDLVGFGRSEKPPTQYTQALWECMLWDFVREVIQTPVYIAGNSIGGYISCAFAADSYGDLCVGVCLINTAGKLEDTTSSQPAAKKSDKLSLFQYSMKHSRALRMVVGNLFLRILRTRVRKTLTIMYPVNGDAADDQLEDEILRNSYDYGAVEVIASGFILPPPRSINALLHKYQGPLLVFQGVLDPLNKTRSRAEKLKQEYPKATIVCVEAGHCPHEEDAEGFVEAISSWMDSVAHESGKEVALQSNRQTVV